MNNEKRFIPGTNPNWGLELPDDDYNSLTTKYGEKYDNGYNFDEKYDKEDKEEKEEKEDKEEREDKELDFDKTNKEEF